jgi:hypothetical protein
VFKRILFSELKPPITENKIKKFRILKDCVEKIVKLGISIDH